MLLHGGSREHQQRHLGRCVHAHGSYAHRQVRSTLRMRAHARTRTRAHAGVRAHVHTRGCARTGASACTRAHVRACAYACACGECFAPIHAQVNRRSVHGVLSFIFYRIRTTTTSTTTTTTTVPRGLPSGGTITTTTTTTTITTTTTTGPAVGPLELEWLLLLLLRGQLSGP